jgi:hypothetical protein
MPLERASGLVRADIDGIHFPMQDAKTSKVIPCKVTYEYLQDRTGLATYDQEQMLEAFATLRGEIEAMTSAKYDRGEPPHVTKADL